MINIVFKKARSDEVSTIVFLASLKIGWSNLDWAKSWSNSLFLNLQKQKN